MSNPPSATKNHVKGTGETLAKADVKPLRVHGRLAVVYKNSYECRVATAFGPQFWDYRDTHFLTFRPSDFNFKAKLEGNIWIAGKYSVVLVDPAAKNIFLLCVPKQQALKEGFTSPMKNHHCTGHPLPTASATLKCAFNEFLKT